VEFKEPKWKILDPKSLG